MNSVYHFSLFQYRYSQALGEVLNVGVLLLFPEQRQALFVYPKRLSRIRKLYPKFADKVISSYLRGIATRARQLSNQPEIFADYEGHPRRLIDNEIFVRDSSSLEFSEVKTGVLSTEDLAEVGKQYYHLYLSFYDLDESPVIHDDAYLLKEYQRRLRQRLDSLLSREAFENPITVKPEGTDFTYQFPFAWQNGSYNLVKPVSFDLKKEQSITNKAILNWGQFKLLAPYAEQRNAQFDVLVARPKNKRLYKTYDQAILLLTEEPHVNVIEEPQLDAYSEKTAAALLAS